MRQPALDGITVLDIGHGVSGPYATRLLADLGADVYKLEKPGEGDFVRRSGPPLGPGSSAAPATGVLFEALNWNKRSIELDLADASARPRLVEMLEAADVVVTSLRPQTLARWQLLPDDLLSVNPRLSVVAVTNFGLRGPKSHYEASDLVLTAASGIMAISGSQGREPLKHGWNTSLFAAGLNAAYVALAGYWTASRTGEGVGVDLAIRDCLASELVMNNAFYGFCDLVQGTPPQSSDPLDGNPLNAGKGYVSLQTSTRIPVARLSQLFDDESFARPELQDPQDRIAHSAELRGALELHLSSMSASDLFQRASAEGYLSGFVQGVDELLDCPHLTERGVFHDLDTDSPLGRPWRIPASVVSMSGSSVTVRRAAPRLGQDNRSRPQRRPQPLFQRSTPPGPSSGEGPGPLSGLRVLDLSTVFAVPYLGGLLADFGAEVIKVESPVRPDQTRTDWGGYFCNDPGDEPWNRGATFQVVNRGKKSAAINLATESGRSLLRGLVATSDVLLENFTPRVMKSWRLSYEDLLEDNPALIMLSNTGYGATGPWSSFKAQGTTLEATMGLMGLTGYHGGPPMRAGQSTPDFFACWAGLMAIFAALISREGSGRGQHIDLGMYQLGASVLTDAVIDFQASGRVPQPLGARDADAFASGVFATSDAGGWVAVSVGKRQLRRLYDVMGVPREERPIDPSARAIELLLTGWSGERSAEEAERDLQRIGVAASAVLDAEGLASDRQLMARGFYEPVAIRGLGGVRPLIGRPYRWLSSTTSVKIAGDAPRYGEHNSYVLEELLHVANGQSAQLRRDGVIADQPTLLQPARGIEVESALRSGLFRRRSRARV